MHITEWYTVMFHNHWNSKKDRLSFDYRRATNFYSTEVEPEPEGTTLNHCVWFIFFSMSFNLTSQDQKVQA